LWKIVNNFLSLLMESVLKTENYEFAERIVKFSRFAILARYSIFYFGSPVV